MEITEEIEVLREVAEQFKAGKGDFHWAYISGALGDYSAGYIAKAFYGSLDAAKALHEELLSDEWTAQVTVQITVWGPGNECRCQLSTLVYEPIEVRNKCPARAWLIAIVRAQIAELEAS